MRDLFLLIRPRFISFINRLRFSGRVKNRRVLLMGLLGSGFCGLSFLLSCRVLIYFQSVEDIGNLLARHLLGMVFLVFFSLLLFSHIITALSNLYLSKDLELCHSTPVDLQEVFVSRSIYTFMDSSWMLIIFGLPILLAYGYVYRPGPGFYFALFHMSLAMALIAGSIGILITMLLVYIFPARRTRDLILLLSVIMIIALYFMFRFMRPERLVNPESFFTLMQYMNALKAPQSPYLPSQWITETLWGALIPSSEKGCVFEILLMWTTAASLVVIDIWVAGAVYFQGFSKSQEAKSRMAGSGRLLDIAAGLIKKPFSQDVGAVLEKDVRTFFRDNTQWSQLLLLVALVVVYLYNFSVLPIEKSFFRVDFLQNLLGFLNMGLAGLVLSAISARFIFTAVSAEGESYWIIQTSPIGLRRYLWGKFFFFVFPVMILMELLIVCTNYLLEVTGFMMILSSVTMFFAVFAITAMGVGLGAVYPRFRHENISQVSTSFGGLVYMMLSALYIVALIVLEAGPVYVLFMSRFNDAAISSWHWIYIIASFTAAFALTVFAVVKSMKHGLRALRDYE